MNNKTVRIVATICVAVVGVVAVVWTAMVATGFPWMDAWASDKCCPANPPDEDF